MSKKRTSYTSAFKTITGMPRYIDSTAEIPNDSRIEGKTTKSAD